MCYGTRPVEADPWTGYERNGEVAAELDLSNFYSSFKLWPKRLCGEKSIPEQCATVVHTALPANGCPLLGLTFAGPGTEIEWISLPELRKP